MAGTPLSFLRRAPIIVAQPFPPPSSPCVGSPPLTEPIADVPECTPPSPAALPVSASGGSPAPSPTAVGLTSSSAKRKASSLPQKWRQQHLPFARSTDKAPVEEPDDVAGDDDDEDHEPTDQESSKDPQAAFAKAHRRFKSSWESLFPWLVLDRADDGFPLLRCSTCLEHGVSGADTKYGFNELVEAASKYLREEQLKNIANSPYLGIAIDESTDRVRGKHLIVYVTYIKDGYVRTEFLTLLTVQKCDAASLTEVLETYMRSVGINMEKIVGISTDGASVMFREVTVEGVDKEDAPTVHTFTLSEEPWEGQKGKGDYPTCVKLCREYAAEAKARLEHRLDDLQDLNGAKLFRPLVYPEDWASLMKKAREWLALLDKLFHFKLHGVNFKTCVSELHLFLHTMNTNHANLGFHKSMKLMLDSTDYEGAYPNIVRLWQAVAVLPLSTVECERGFSRQNRIKSWTRSCLGDGKLEDLMTVALVQCDMEWLKMVEIFRTIKDRRPATQFDMTD
ncbi:hypothetical protein CLOP_g11535 [Closterium sp. NIES-67]|nr:hypothetical protein CLOP_g11535 [Closterium sp. NIES-67]